ncbi:Nuclear RNA export factor [Nesidiocoris tenuis]|uniref:Nuclear RNA export factor n=1 Tax=Nesidiocoris tenuis TaxID=355587 RepID=A0ABN7B8D9_9HEMI|nr:Nuclear RNA export factor [Nesidiocoris tenuis]
MDSVPGGPFLITRDNYFDKIRELGSKLADLANAPGYWHRLTLQKAAHHNKEAILEHITSEYVIVPVKYKTYGEDGVFFFNSHGAYLGVKLMTSAVNSQHAPLTIRVPSLKETFNIELVLQYKSLEQDPLDVFGIIGEVVDKRTNKGTTDLRNFKNDPKFEGMYISLNCRPVSQIIYAHVNNEGVLSKHVKHFILSHNELDKINLDSFVKRMGIIDTLDLRYNKLTYSALEQISRTANSCEFSHLLLEGNPLCNDFETASEMICEIKKMFPFVQCLDNIDINIINKKLNDFKVYMRNPKFSCLTDHFLHHYFKLFESDCSKLAVMYHEKASLSFVFHRQPFVSTASDEFFSSSNRNLLSMSDVTKTYDNLFLGKTRIVEALGSIPKIRFDPNSFRVDVPVTAKGELVVISCTGVFCLVKTDDVFSFSRVCILAPLRDGLGEWLILNDMWTVTNESPLLSLKYFTKAKRQLKSDLAVMLDPQLKDKEVLVHFVSGLTHLKNAWVEKFLSESAWDLESTLLAFVDQYKANLVPPEAFLPFP